MAGITYQLVKKYEDRFIYSIIKWNSKYYSPTSIGVSLVVDDISKFDEMSVGFGWNEDELLSKEQDLVYEFWHTFIARYQMGKIELATFEGILDGLKVGQGINELREQSKGSAIKNIPPFAVFKRILFPMPPLSEQNRILSRLTEILLEVDKLE